MSYVIKAVLSNPQRPECGQITVPFPIEPGQYDQTIEMLQKMDLGFSVNRDCKVDEIDSRYHVLNSIQGTLVNVDQLDYLAKRLDGFCSGEVSQFQAMAHKLKLVDIKDFINLTYCCQQATVIGFIKRREETPVQAEAPGTMTLTLATTERGGGERDLWRLQCGADPAHADL